MKFLPEFALCWGGASITPTAIDGAIPDEERNRVGNSSAEGTIPSAIRGGRGRRIVNSRNGANWKPALRVIAEERVMSDIVVDGNGGGRKERAVVPSSSCAKSKIKVKSIARSKLSPRHGDDYWKSTSPMAVPAFAPTAFLF